MCGRPHRWLWSASTSSAPRSNILPKTVRARQGARATAPVRTHSSWSCGPSIRTSTCSTRCTSGQRGSSTSPGSTSPPWSGSASCRRRWYCSRPAATATRTPPTASTAWPRTSARTRRPTPACPTPSTTRPRPCSSGPRSRRTTSISSRACAAAPLRRTRASAKAATGGLLPRDRRRRRSPPPAPTVPSSSALDAVKRQARWTAGRRRPGRCGISVCRRRHPSPSHGGSGPVPWPRPTGRAVELG
mmetsp:Transcript_11321/g.24321  ORF Transcript_11321/g.24321 Transcript_11321/m.24321 type:complete len:245 (+) Transcript_11321:226-960(+)